MTLTQALQKCLLSQQVEVGTCLLSDCLPPPLHSEQLQVESSGRISAGWWDLAQLV